MQKLRTVEIRVKKYVKQFAIVNFDEPCNFMDDTFLSWLLMRGLMRRPDRRKKYYTKEGKRTYPPKIENFYNTWDKTISDDPDNRPATLTIQIPEFWHENYGWIVSKTYQLKINNALEERAKYMMRFVILHHWWKYLSLNDAIHYFQDKFCFQDHIWDYEAIRKDFMRTHLLEQFDPFKDNFDDSTNKVTKLLSDFGTLTKEGVKQYELNK